MPLNLCPVVFPSLLCIYTPFFMCLLPVNLIRLLQQLAQPSLCFLPLVSFLDCDFALLIDLFASCLPFDPCLFLILSLPDRLLINCLNVMLLLCSHLCTVVYKWIQIAEHNGSPQIVLQQQTHNHSFSLQPRQRGGLDHLSALSRTFPHPCLHQLQRSQFLIHGRCKLQDLNHLSSMLGNIDRGELWRQWELEDSYCLRFRQNWFSDF